MKALILFLLLLGGCAERIATVREGATIEARALKDVEARALTDSTCLMGIGAWNRLTNSNERAGSMLLCGAQITGDYEIKAGDLTIIANDTD